MWLYVMQAQKDKCLVQCKSVCGEPSVKCETLVLQATAAASFSTKMGWSETL